MKKLLIITLLLMLFPATANAHSGLASSTPTEGETLEESPTEIQFLFESAIQQGNMTVTDESGKDFPVSDISFSDKELLGQLDEELPNGAYTVDWNVISQDSHEITGTLTFNVATEAAEEEGVEENDDEATSSEDVTETPEVTEEDPAESSAATEKQQEQTAASADEAAQPGFSVMTILIVAILAIAAITFFVIARRK